jgi:transposase
MVDGYAAYATIPRAGPGISLSHGLAHVRRKFVEIESFYPEECKQVLDLIRGLYEVERKVPFRPAVSAEERADDLARRFVLRGERSRSIARDVLAWAGGLRLTRESVLHEAVEYMTDRWAGLTRFLDDPRVPLDNSRLDRALRPLAVGRKNFLGSRSERGLVVASVLYSLIETVKLCEVDPRRYLLAAVHAALGTPRRVLLPRDLRG